MKEPQLRCLKVNVPQTWSDFTAGLEEGRGEEGQEKASGSRCSCTRFSAQTQHPTSAPKATSLPADSASSPPLIPAASPQSKQKTTCLGVWRFSMEMTGLGLNTATAAKALSF